MAARIRRQHQDEVRARIQVVQLVNFLEAVALTGKDTGGQEVNPARIQAAKILLDKSISNAPTEITGEDGGNLTIQLVRYADDSTAT